jgi:hypothetical protein
MKNKIIVISWIVSIIIAVIITKLYFPNIKLEIIDSYTEETQHQIPTNNIDINNPEDCRVAKNCANSDLKQEVRTEGNKLIGKVYDDCKSMDFYYEFKASLTARHIIQGGIGWAYDIGYYVRPGYLYQTDLIAFGGSFILPKDKKHFGFEIMGQKALSF